MNRLLGLVVFCAGSVAWAGGGRGVEVRGQAGEVEKLKAERYAADPPERTKEKRAVDRATGKADNGKQERISNDVVLRPSPKLVVDPTPPVQVDLLGGMKLKSRSEASGVWLPPKEQESASYATRLGVFKKADLGEYVTKELEGNTGEVRLVYNRDKARSAADRLSTDTNVFAYYYFGDGQGKGASKRIHVHGRDMELKTWLDAPDRSPRRLVFFGEPDYQGENGTLMSPVMERLQARSVDANGPSALFTMNADRASAKISQLDRQVGWQHRLTFIEADGLDRLPLAPEADGDTRADTVVVLLARNVEQFRRALARSAAEGRIEGKRIVLITCGNDLDVSATLTEELLSHGALTVWRPDRQIPEPVGRKLFDRLQRTVDMAGAVKPGEDLVRSVLQQWSHEEPNDADIKSLVTGQSWVVREPNGCRSYYRPDGTQFLSRDSGRGRA